VLLGAFLIAGLPELFRDLQSYRLLFFGAAMVAMMIFRPQGLVPPRRRRYDVQKYLARFPCAVASRQLNPGNGPAASGLPAKDSSSSGAG
jgi:branched-chain amino acid transport system permease protein